MSLNFVLYCTSHLGQNHGLFREGGAEGLVESSTDPKSSPLSMKRPQTLPISTNIGLTETTKLSHGSYSQSVILCFVTVVY